MEATSVVVAFAESPRLRETLSVLLERDCALRFLNPSLVAPPLDIDADVAVVAAPRASGLLRSLTVHWPRCRIVVVDTEGDPESTRSSSVALGAVVRTIPLEPYAIRHAVLEHLSAPPRSALCATVRSVAETLGAELQYPFAALRTLTIPSAAVMEPLTGTLLGTIVREQTEVLDASSNQTQRFRDRPRAVEMSSQFVPALCRRLQEADRDTVERGVLCECTTEEPVAPSVGPLTLVPTVSSFLHAHLRRRVGAPVVSVRVTKLGVLIRYQPRRASPADGRSWPLLLAALALRPWSWCVSAATQAQEETVGLYPA